jgi:hypothetical protein
MKGGLALMSKIIKMEQVRQTKQSQYLKKNRARLDAFIRSRIPLNWGGDILKMAAEHHGRTDADLVWDYVEVREILLEVVTEQIAKDLFEELEKQYWFDERWITLDAVSERCLSLMIIGEAVSPTLLGSN